MGRLRECREKANLSQKYVDQKKKPKNAVFLGYFYEMTFNYYFIRWFSAGVSCLFQSTFLPI